MEATTFRVRELEPTRRKALESVLGKALSDGDSVEIRVEAGPAGLPDWLDVYKGLSEEEIADIEATFRPRMPFSREPEAP
jgi:hypothetical protein